MKIVVVVFSANVLFNPQIGGLSGFYCGLNCAKWKPKGFYTEIRTQNQNFCTKGTYIEEKGSIFQVSTLVRILGMERLGKYLKC